LAKEEERYPSLSFTAIAHKTNTNNWKRWVVYDLDTTLPFPCSFELYAEKALRYDERLNETYQRYIYLHTKLNFDVLYFL
jgi:hypothetical protein